MKEYEIRYRSLPNDVRHLEIMMPERETASCMVLVKTGSRNEIEKGEAGISHALEHKIYLGSRKRSGSDRGFAVDRLGSNESASTEKEYTQYYINLRYNHLPKALELLSEIFKNPTFPRGVVKIENESIVGEIKDYRDDFQSTVEEEFESLLYNGSEMAEHILGNPRSVKSQSKRDLLNYMNKWYRGKNMMVVLAGNVKRTGKLVEKYFGSLAAGPAPSFEGRAIFGKPDTKVITKNTDQAHFVVGVPGLSLGDPEYFTMRAIEVILGGHQVLDDRTVQTSKIFTQVRSKRGLAYEISTMTFSGADSGYLIVSGSAQPNNLNKTLDIVRKEMYGLSQSVTREDVAIAKQFLVDFLTTELDTPEKAALLIGVPTLFLDRRIIPSEMFATVDAIDLKKVRSLAERLLIQSEERLVVLGPFDKNLRRVPKSER